MLVFFSGKRVVKVYNWSYDHDVVAVRRHIDTRHAQPALR